MRWSNAVALAWVMVAWSPGCEAEALVLDTEGLRATREAVEQAQPSEPAVVELEGEIIRGAVIANPGEPPPGYVQMTPTLKSASDFGGAVLLLDPTEKVVVPIFIGGTEALSIRLRLLDRRYNRPLTHDLMDAAIEKLGGKVIRAQVDALRDSIYIGTVVLKKGNEVIQLDARPSDAIALAIGNRAPIFVSKELLDEAGIAIDRFDDERPEQPKGMMPVAL